MPGVADDSGLGGTVMQYQVLLDPARLYGYHLTVPQVIQALSVNNANAGGGFYSQGGQFYYVRGIGLVRNQEDIGNIIVGSNKGIPIRVRDIGEVEIGNAPRLGQFGFQISRKTMMMPSKASSSCVAVNRRKTCSRAFRRKPKN